MVTYLGHIISAKGVDMDKQKGASCSDLSGARLGPHSAHVP
jgi:hypothetical protein